MYKFHHLSNDYMNQIYESIHPGVMMYRSIDEQLIDNKKPIDINEEKINAFIENEAQLQINGVNFVMYKDMFSFNKNDKGLKKHHQNVKDNYISRLSISEQSRINALISSRIDEIKKNTSDESIDELIKMFNKKTKKSKGKKITP